MKTSRKWSIPIFVRLFPFFEPFMPILIRLITIFDRFVPVFANYFLERTLKTWKNKGLIVDYETRTTRTAKLHYNMDIYIVLTWEQAKIFLKDLATEILRRLKSE
jgi:hypothetical protein